jgi:hypothetical protein
MTARVLESLGMKAPGDWDAWMYVIADVPWGVVAFFTVLILLLTDHLSGDDITGLGTAAGLLGVGHGIHIGAKHLSRRMH